MVAHVMNRWLPEHHHHPPLSSPVSRHSHRLNFYLGIVLAVFMAVSVVALVCCCYHLEWRLRLQARNAARRVNRGNAGLQGAQERSTRGGKKIKQEQKMAHLKLIDSLSRRQLALKWAGRRRYLSLLAEASTTAQVLRTIRFSRLSSSNFRLGGSLFHADLFEVMFGSQMFDFVKLARFRMPFSKDSICHFDIIVAIQLHWP